MLRLLSFRRKKKDLPAAAPALTAAPANAANPLNLPEVPAEHIVNALFGINGDKPDPSLFVVEPKRGGARNVRALFISGTLDLSDCTLEHALRFTTPSLTLNGCYFENELTLQGARLGAIDLRGATIPKGIRASTIRVNGGIDLSYADVEGGIDLEGARIEGNLLFNGAKVSAGDEENIALSISSAIIEGALLFNPLEGRRFKSKGMIEGIGTTVTGGVSFSGAKCLNPGGAAVEFQGATVGSSLFMQLFRGERFKAEGSVSFMMANIKGAVALHGAKISNPGGIALTFEDAEIGGAFSAWGEKGKPRFKTEGIFVLFDTDIAGETSLSGALLVASPKENYALNMTGAKIYANLVLGVDADNRRIEIEGDAALTGLTVTNDLICSHARFGGNVYAASLKVAGRLCFINGTTFGGVLDLRNGDVGEINDGRPPCWPKKGDLILDGLVYKRFSDSREDSYASVSTAESRLRWLELQPFSQSTFLPIPSQPYLQLARVLTLIGQKDQAIRVLVKLESRRLQHDWLFSFDSTPWLFAPAVAAALGASNTAALLIVVAIVMGVLDYFGAWALDRIGLRYAARAWRRRPPFGLFSWLPRVMMWTTAGHGYYPRRAFYWLFILVLCGWYVFDLAHKRGLMYPNPTMSVQMDNGFAGAKPSLLGQPPTYPPFDAMTYSVNVLVPFLDLHQLSHWTPLSKRERPCAMREGTSGRDCSAIVEPAPAINAVISAANAALEKDGPFSWLTWLSSWPNWVSETANSLSSGRWIEEWIDEGFARTWLMVQMLLGLALSVIFAAGFAGLLQPKEE